MAFVEHGDVNNAEQVRRFAISQALSVNASDHERRRVTEELWQHLTLRGTTLLARRGIPTSTEAQMGWSVAEGS
jgi:hypothetical protein